MRQKQTGRVCCVFKKWAVCLAVCLAAVFMVPSFPARALSARSYALVEQTTGRLVEGSNENTRRPMASTTKIMTGLLACESGRLDETFQVPAEALTVEGSSMGLQPDESVTLRTLVYGLMLESGNDAANAIAMLLGGSIDGFAAQMNAKAQELGLANTHFANPSGLDDKDHYTTALDLARLGAYAMKNADFAQIVGTKSIRVTYNGAANGRTLTNHNRLLGSYDGEIGIKTGFTDASGRCLVSCATRGGVTLVAVTLNDPDDWKDHASLLDAGFTKLKAVPLMDEALEQQVKVQGGVANTVTVRAEADAAAALQDAERSRVQEQKKLPAVLKAPVQAGQQVGELVFTLDGVEVARQPVFAVNGVACPPKPSNPLVAFFAGIGAFFKGLFT